MAYAKYLNLNEATVIDNSVKKFSYYPKEPALGTDLNSNTEVKIIIEQTGNWHLPAISYLYVEGQLVKADGTPITKTNGIYPEVALTNNFFPFMCDNIKYSINDEEVENLLYPGIITEVDTLLTRPNNFNGLEEGWALDTADGGANPHSAFTNYPLTDFTPQEIFAVEASKLPAPTHNLTNGEYRLYSRLILKRFNNTNGTNLTIDDAGIPVPANRVNMTTTMNNLIIKINGADTVYVEIPNIDGATIPDDDLDSSLLIALNLTIAQINKYLPSRKLEDFGADINTGYNLRHDLLFNEIGNVMPEANAGKFTFRIPLSSIFNFCRIYDKVIFNCKHELAFRRQGDDWAIFRSNNLQIDSYKIRLDKVTWFMPKLETSDEVSLELKSIIANDSIVDMAFMNKTMQMRIVPPSVTEFPMQMTYNFGTSTPRYFVAVFQSRDLLPTLGYDRMQNFNNSIFNDPNARFETMIDIKRIRIMVNDNNFYINDFAYNDFSRNFAAHYYNEYKKFKKDYLGTVEETDMISYQDFINLYRIYVINVANNPIPFPGANCNVIINFEFNNPIPTVDQADVRVYVTTYTERLWKLKSDGTKQFVISK